MITVTVTTQALETKAQSVLEREVMHNPNLNGAEYVIERGDFDSIEPNNATTTPLYIKIFQDN